MKNKISVKAYEEYLQLKLKLNFWDKEPKKKTDKKRLITCSNCKKQRLIYKSKLTGTKNFCCRECRQEYIAKVGVKMYKKIA